MPALVYLFAGLDGGAVSIGTVVAFTTLQTRIFWPIQSLLNVSVDVKSSSALFERVFEYLDMPVDIHPGTRDLPAPRGDVHLDDVWFRYAAGDEDGDERWTLAGVDTRFPAGTRTAIVGETGSGKTTLGYLVARLYDAERGAVRIDGVDVRELRFDSLADTVGVVSQETYLFHASVRENLRIAIARTILRNPPVLVLDEATSALDVQTERAVEEALDRLAEGRTTIVIAHRLSTVRQADQIVVLDAGRVAERGTHDELLAAGGRYAAMVARDSAPAVAYPEPA